MALRLKFRSLSISQLHRSLSTATISPSLILDPDSKTPLSSKEKSRAALNLLRTESNPERILQICRAAALTPASHLDRIAFSKTINKLRELNYFSGIREFLEESIIRPDIKSERAADFFIVLYGQAGLQSDAIKVFDKMPELGINRTVKTLNAVLTACVFAKDYKEMKRVYVDFPKMYDIVPNLDTYNEVIKGLCESGEASHAFSILAEMGSKGVKPNSITFGLMIAGLYQEEKFEEVGKVMEAMKEHKMTPGIGIFNTRIHSLCKLKRSKEAKALLEGLVSRGIKPNIVTYSNLIHGFAREGDLEEAKGLFERMVRVGIKPDSQVYFTLVYFLCQAKDFEAALTYARACIEKDWVPNFSTMKTLVEGLAGISMVDEAKEIIGTVKGKFTESSDKWTEVEEGLATVEG